MALAPFSRILASLIVSVPGLAIAAPATTSPDPESNHVENAAASRPTPQPTDTPPAEAAQPVSPQTTDATPPTPAVDPQATAALQEEARALQDRLFKARARVAIVGSKLFKSKIGLEVRSNLERFYNVTDLVVTLDGAPVYRAEQGMPKAAGNVFEAFAAPGPHALGVSADLTARRDGTYKMRVQQTFTIVVPENSAVSSRLILRETGNMWRFSKRRRGHHNVNFKLKARAKKNKGGGRRRQASNDTDRRQAAVRSEQ